jgi:hypothetical protein
MPLLKTRASWDDLILAPSVQNARGCICMTCGRLVDFEGVVEGLPCGAERPGHDVVQVPRQASRSRGAPHV